MKIESGKLKMTQGAARRITLLLLILFPCLLIQAQQQDIYLESYPRESLVEDDNQKYFYDIAVDAGLYIPMDEASDFAGGSTINISGAYYFDNKWGVRSGLSLISDMEGSDAYLKVPVLFSYRTKLFQLNWDDSGSDTDDFSMSDFLLGIFFSLFPSRLEFNTGPSLGYMTSNPNFSYHYQNGQAITSGTFGVKSQFAASWDANIRLSYQIWRIGITGSFGVNYLFTKNYQYRCFLPMETYEPKWFGNLSLGASFSF